MIATPLVQRWAVERAFRPAVPGIEWLGFAKPLLREFECFACGETGTQQGVLRTVPTGGPSRTLFACPTCGSHRYDAPPPAPVEPSAMMVRHHVEYAADLPATARMLARVLRPDDPGSVLIAGCGFGFGVAMARAAGWAAFGFDPDPLARAGHQAFGITVAHRATPDPVGPGRFDAVCADGVLGRAEDPYTLAVELAGRLSDDGALLIEEPDVAVLYAADHPSLIQAAAAPSRSMLLPTAVGLTRLLNRAGFGDRAVTEEAGRLRVGRNADSPQDFEIYLSAYLDDWTPVCAPDGRSEGLHAGIAVRALERAVNAADWSRARAVAEALQPMLSGVTTLAAMQTGRDGLFASNPFGAPSAVFHAAMLALNGDHDPARARASFAAAAALSRAAYASDATAMLPEADRVWAARFHAALAGRAAGDVTAAAALDAIVHSRTDPSLPPPSSVWISRAADLLQDPTPTPETEPPSSRTPVARRKRRAP